MLGFTYLKLEYSLNSEERTKNLFCSGRENVCAFNRRLGLYAIQIFSLNRTFKKGITNVLTGSSTPVYNILIVTSWNKM